MNYASGAAVPQNPELVQVVDAIGQRAQGGGIADRTLRCVAEAPGAAPGATASPTGGGRCRAASARSCGE